jgi:hypothetical protein
MELSLGRRLRLVAACLTIATLLGSLGPGALAHPPGEGEREDEGLPPGLEDFEDLPASHWAWPYVRLMGARGILHGYGNGHFGPQDPVSRIEIVVLTTRLRGAEAEARALESRAVDAALEAAFHDHDTIPAWPGAREGVAYALQKGYLWPLTVGGDGNLRATRAATRVEAAVMLLEAAGLGGEARSLAGVSLDFKDATDVPEWARAYLALAVRLRILQGREGKLWPNAPVTRCEMAAMMSRLCERVRERLEEGEEEEDDDGARLGFGPGRRILTGDVQALSLSTKTGVPSTITILLGGRYPRLEGIGSVGGGGGGGTGAGGGQLHPLEPVTFELAPGVVVMERGAQVRLADVQVGDHVALYLDATGKVLLIEIEEEAAGPTVVFIAGVLAGWTLDAAGRLVTVTLGPLGGPPKTYPVAPGATLTRDGHPAAVGDLRVGQAVLAEVDGNTVHALDIMSADSGSPSPTPGMDWTVLAVVRDEHGRVTVLSVRQTAHGGGTGSGTTTVVYLVSPAVVITHNGLPGAPADVVVGAQVRLRVESGYVVSIEVV